MRAEREGHPPPHAVQTEGSPGASGKYGAPGAAGESGEDRPADRSDPGAPSGDVELGVRAPRGTSPGHGGDRVREAEAGRETAPGGALARSARDRGTGEVLRGIQMGTICLRKADGMKLELERVSTPRPEEALVLH